MQPRCLIQGQYDSQAAGCSIEQPMQGACWLQGRMQSQHATQQHCGTDSQIFGSTRQSYPLEAVFDTDVGYSKVTVLSSTEASSLLWHTPALESLTCTANQRASDLNTAPQRDDHRSRGHRLQTRKSTDDALVPLGCSCFHEGALESVSSRAGTYVVISPQVTALVCS